MPRLTDLCRPVLDRMSISGCFCERIKDVVDGSWAAPTQVIDSGQVIRCQRQVISVGTIAYIDEVPRLFAIAVDDHRLAQQHFSRKDRDHSRFTVRVLTGPKYIRITQYGVRQAII